MIVRRISVSCFGRFVKPFEVELRRGQPNLLDGANGSGKSTLLAALTSAFTLPASSTAEEIRRWQPWGREVHPRVTAEFEHGVDRWRLTKEFTFSQRGRATLERFQAGQWALVAQGRHVDERLPEFLGAPQGGAGTWLAAGVLWARQNELAEFRLEQPLQERIRNSFGAQIRSGAVETVLREVKRLYELDWPPQGRALRQNSPARVLEAELTALRKRVRLLEDDLAELERDRDQLENAQGECSVLEAQKTALEARLRELGEKVAERRGLDGERLEAEKSVQEALHEMNSAAAALKLRQTIAADLAAAEKALCGLEERLQQARVEVKQTEDAWVEARAGAAARAAEARAQLRSLNAPPQDVLDRLARLGQQLREEEAKLEGALLHLRLELERDARLEVLRGSPEGAIEGQAGESVEISGSPEIELALPGLGRMRIWGPAASVEELQREIASVRAARDSLAEPWGGADLDLLQEKRRQAEALEREIERFQKEMEAHEKGASPQAAAAARCRDAVRGLEEQHRQTQEMQRNLLQQKAALDSDPRDDGALQQAKEEAARRLAVGEVRLKELRERLALLPADLEREQQCAEDELVRRRNQLEQARERKARLSGRIEQKQKAGAYALLAEAEERMTAKEQEYESALRRANANRLLWQTLNGVLEDAERQVLPRLEERTVEILSRISGRLPSGLRLDPSSWTPAAVQPAAEAEEPMDVKPERISGGEQEQLYVALRLALADILTEKEPQLVVLDDVLLATDSHRLERILSLIEERRNRMQFLILTCHPERFEGLADFHRIRLGGAAAAE